jgi:uncharacterized protein YggE
MKYRLHVLLAILLSSASISSAEETKSNPNIITVKGVGELDIPADFVDIGIEAEITGKSTKEVEENGYKIGLKIKNVFKNFGLNETSINSSKIVLNDTNSYTQADKEKKYQFYITYDLHFNNFELIDTLREKMVQAGATSFQVGQLHNVKKLEHEAKVKALAFQNAKENALATIQNSGFTLSNPLRINGSAHNEDRTISFAESQMAFGAAPYTAPKRESLLQQRKIHLRDVVEVDFKIE